MKASLPGKFATALTVLLAFVSVVAAMNLYSAYVLQKQLQAGTLLDIQSGQALSDLDRRTALSHATTYVHLSSAATVDMARYEGQIAQWDVEIEAAAGALQGTLQQQDELDRLRQFAELWKEYARTRDEQLLPLSRTGRKAEALALAQDQGSAGAAARASFEALAGARDAHSASAVRRLELLGQDNLRRQRVLLIATAGTISAALIAVAFLVLQLGAGLRAVLQQTKLMAEGDLDWHISIRSGDELESISESLHKITRNMRRMLSAKREAGEQLQRASSDLKSARAAMAAGERRFAATVALVDSAVVTTDASGNVGFLNRAAENLTGWTLSDAVGQPVAQVCWIVNAETRERCENPVERVLQSGGMLSFANQTALVSKDGTEHRIMISSAPIHDAEGNLLGAAFVLRELLQA